MRTAGWTGEIQHEGNAMKLLGTTAAVLAIATTGAMAQVATTAPLATATPIAIPMTVDDLYGMQADLIRTRDITGGRIYTMNEAYDEGSWDMTPRYDAVDAGWNDIGEIEDIVLSKDGEMIGVVGEIGGFLGVGDKHVMIPIGDVRLTAVDDRSYALVTRFNEEQLEQLPSVDEGFWD
jgi:hypothetical protein